MAEPLKPSIDEINNFAGAVFVTLIASVVFYRAYKVHTALLLLGASLFTILMREIGQRTIAQWMNAEVNLEFSPQGSVTTLIGALISFISGIPFIALFPVSSSFDVTGYEHWGKSIDAMWLKRKYWLVSGGIIALLIGRVLLGVLEFNRGAEILSIFLIFQMMPFNYSKIPTGALDGSIVIRWSGFMWLLFTGLAILSLLTI